MVTKKEIIQVIAIYVHEKKMHSTMYTYIKAVIERGKSPMELKAMSKEELWGLVVFMGESLHDHLGRLGGLSTRICRETMAIE
jgi:hypothetical protein